MNLQLAASDNYSAKYIILAMPLTLCVKWLSICAMYAVFLLTFSHIIHICPLVCLGLVILWLHVELKCSLWHNLPNHSCGQAFSYIKMQCISLPRLRHPSPTPVPYTVRHVALQSMLAFRHVRLTYDAGWHGTGKDYEVGTCFVDKLQL